MAIFDKIGEFAKNASEKAGEFAKSATEKAGDKIEITRLNAKIKAEHQTILGYKAELGSRYWDRIASGAQDMDDGDGDIVQKIKTALANIEGIEADISKIEEERAAAEAQAKTADEAKQATIIVAAPAPYVQTEQPVQPAQTQTAPDTFQTDAPVQGEYSFGAPARPAQAVQTAPPSAGLLCTNCSATLNPGTKFCQECGTPAPTAAPVKRFCPNCGTELTPDVRFCPDCGTKA